MIAWLLAAALTGAAPTVPEPAEYHGEPYRSAVPATLAGALVVDAAGAAEAQAHGAALIDVLPRTARPAGLPPGTLWRDPPHATIPGAIWLPGVGYDALPARDEQRLKATLAEVTKADKAGPVLFFCKADCWMSWNAARRAVALGYTGVLWFPGGTDDWAAAGKPFSDPARIVP